MDTQDKLNELDKNLAFLKEKGLKEIHKITKIANPKLEAILDKRFEDLQRVHAVGFLQILEKEYELDLSHWLVEYDKVLFVKPPASPSLENETTPPSEELPFVDTKRSDPEILKTFQPKKSSKWAWVALAILLVGAGVYTYRDKMPFMASKSDQQTPQVLETPPPQSQSEASTLQNNPTPQNPSSPSPPPSTNFVDMPTQTPTTPSQDNAQQPSTQEKEDSTQQTPSAKPDTILIIPKEEMWMETIDLTTKRKTQVTLKEPFSLETKKHRWLLAFGHGSLSLEANGQTLDFDQERPLRFLYTPKKGLRRVSYTHYQEWSR
ncbi:hypothetical protein [Helicobacter felis]|uniref:Membrane protein n=1 Tax=Helicobacter felis (strain ATCC 49179 / CCUG 28539 / NCTC 12436 / CS1) TaxID=936155 RepID=E7ACF4_HELFC|nr:hypothetical protein [Helicobacter felis]CBY82183.1 Putative membrane protein [Helicobacter felis ATCC 49179]